VELIENNQPRAGQGWITLQQPGEYALGDDFYPGIGTDTMILANAITNRVPHFLTQHLSHPHCRSPGGYAARFEQ